MKDSAGKEPVVIQAAGAADLSVELLRHRQLILVSAAKTAAEIRCYEKAGDIGWQPSAALGGISGFVGGNGVKNDKREGDGCTPAGLFRLGFAFGVMAKPQTAMAYRQVTAKSLWIDDAESPLYNTWAEDGGPACWKRAERLSDYPNEYAYAVVIEYNTEKRAPGKGSAVFLHCGDKPTSGCVAVPRASMLAILRWLDPGKAPAILIRQAE